MPLTMTKGKVDYSLYLVTDSTSAILGDRDICDVVRGALKGGVTVVQYRDKTSDTGVLIDTARKLLEITRSSNVPLLINDRVDVALAVGCEGVHIGQDDMGTECRHCQLTALTDVARYPHGEKAPGPRSHHWRDC
jgi:thiamine-phosphate diphosphorylase / hydroxyethylthiazole kinase